MPTLLLPPNQNIPVNFAGSRKGWADIEVESSDPIEIYVTDAAGLKEFRRDGGIEDCHAHAADVMMFRKRVQIPRSEPWVLLLINWDKGDAWDRARAITYRVVQGK